MVWEGIKVTKENVDKVSELMERMYQRRKSKLQEIVPTWKDEIEALPEIFKVRMEALKEVNPEKFSDSPELVLGSLTAAYLIKKFPNEDTHISVDELKKAHWKYGVDLGDDVDASNIVEGYYEDIKSGAITRDGRILDIEKSRVMTATHNYSKEKPIDAKTTVAKYKKQDKKGNNISSRLAKFFGKGGQGE